MNVPGYALDNAASQSMDRFTALEACYDGATRDFLRQTGLGPGWRCLEIGAGGGSIGRWLSDVVGADGHVTVTDIAPGRLDSGLLTRENVTALRHDVTGDALPEAAFDLIHARLVLLHIPARRHVLRNLVRALRPGGWLVLDEFDCGWTPVLAARSEEAAAIFRKVHARFLELLTRSGADVLWGRKVFGEFVRAGLSDVSSVTFGMAWRGGSIGASLHRANTSQLASAMTEDAITEEELEYFWTLLEDPEFAVHSYPMISVRGRRAPSPRKADI